jgi:hypothetical protein
MRWGLTNQWRRALAKKTAHTHTLVDTATGEEFEIPAGALLDVWVGFLDCAVNDDKEPDSTIQAILPTEEDPDRLHRLVFKDSGSPFWLSDMRHSGKTAWNAEQEGERTD